MDHYPTIVLYLPLPPSANAMFCRRITRRGKRDLTPQYKAWRDEAGWLAKMQMQTAGATEITCRFDVQIQIPITRGDVDNRIKPLLDLCQSVRAICNDGNANEIRISPVDRPDCMVALTPRPEIGSVRAAAKVPWRTGGPTKARPTAARLRQAEHLRARIPF